MLSSRKVIPLLSLLMVSAPPIMAPLSAQTEQPTATKPQPSPPAQTQQPPTPVDYSKLQYKIPLINEKESEPVVSLAFSPDSQIIAVLYQNSIGFWSTSKGAPIGFAQGTLEKFTALAFGSNGLLVTGGGDGGVTVWDWHDLTRPKLRTGGFDPITAVAVSPDGTLIVTAHRSDTPSVVVWEAGTGKQVKTLSGFSYAPTAMQFSADGAQLLTGGGGLGGRTGDFLDDTPIYSTMGEFTRWNMPAGTLDKQVGLKDASPNCAFSADGKLLAFVGRGAAVGKRTTSWFGTMVRVWRVPGTSENDNGSFMPGTISRPQNDMVYNPGRPAIAFSTDQRVLGFGEDYGITLWSGGVGQGNTLRLGYPYPYRSWYWDRDYPWLSSGAMAFSPNGKMLAAAGRYRAAIWKMVN